MPLINGVCIPPICFEVQFDLTRLVTAFFDTKNGVPWAPPLPPQPQFPKGWNQQLVNDALAIFKNVKIECDGCSCWKFAPWAAWMPVPRARLDHPVVQPHRYRLDVTGIKYRFRPGICMPPGTKVKNAKGEWVPVGEYTAPESPGPSGGKGKSPKKKRVTRRG